MDTTDELNGCSPISQYVVEKVAAETGIDPLELGPLHDHLDPDALNRLFTDTTSNTQRNQGCVIFPMAGCRVIVHADTTVDVIPQGQAPSALDAKTRATGSSPTIDSVSSTPQSPD